MPSAGAPRDLNTQLLACSSSQSVIAIACWLRTSLCFGQCDGAWWGPLAGLPWIPPPHARALPGSTNFVGTNAQAHLLVMSLINAMTI